MKQLSDRQKQIYELLYDASNNGWGAYDERSGREMVDDLIKALCVIFDVPNATLYRKDEALGEFSNDRTD
jgi:hypothetical protein